MIVEPLQKALGNRPNITLDILPMNRDNCIVLLEQNKRFLAWLEYFTRKLAAYRTELELPVGEWLTKNAKTLRELAREEGILTEKWFAHQVPDTEYDKQQDGKWVSVEDVTALLTQVVSDREELQTALDIVIKERNEADEKLKRELSEKLMVDCKQLSGHVRIVCAANPSFDYCEHCYQTERMQCPTGKILFGEQKELLEVSRSLPLCEKCEATMKVVKTRPDGCRYFECPKCGGTMGEETEEWFKQQEGSDEHLNLALAFSDVRMKKKGAGSESK